MAFHCYANACTGNIIVVTSFNVYKAISCCILFPTNNMFTFLCELFNKMAFLDFVFQITLDFLVHSYIIDIFICISCFSSVLPRDLSGILYNFHSFSPMQFLVNFCRCVFIFVALCVVSFLSLHFSKWHTLKLYIFILLIQTPY